MENQFQCHDLWYISLPTNSPKHLQSFQKGKKEVKVLIPRTINKGSFIVTSETVIRFKSEAKHYAKSTTVLLIRRK
jgi:hypothetical protein